MHAMSAAMMSKKSKAQEGRRKERADMIQWNKLGKLICSRNDGGQGSKVRSAALPRMSIALYCNTNAHIVQYTNKGFGDDQAQRF